MIKLRNILSEMLAEYSEEEKQKMGIPSHAVASGGSWFDRDPEEPGANYIGKVVGGKFVPFAGRDVSKPPADKPAASPSQADADTKLYKGIPAGDYVVDKVEDKFEESGLWSKAGESVPADEFEEKTGINRDAMKAYAKYKRGVPAFHYDEKADSVTMDPKRYTM